MKLILQNEIWALRYGLSCLRAFGFLVPGTHSESVRIFLIAYWLFWTVFLDITYIIMQLGDLYYSWGDLQAMVSTSFLMFTNIVFGTKIIVFRVRRQAILTIIEEGEIELSQEERPEGRTMIKETSRETALHYIVYLLLALNTTMGLIVSPGEGSLPTRAWYPYNTVKSPVYEITYAHQSISIILVAAINISMDFIISSLMAACRCRLRLLKLSLKNICSGFDQKHPLTPAQEEVVESRLKDCITRHEATLRSVNEIQACFSEAILCQFVVSMVIICVSAYELSTDIHDSNKTHVVAMLGYLIGMIIQVFQYCYNGDLLTTESSEIAYAAYQCEWYLLSSKLKRSLLVVMVRSRRVAVITAGGFSSLSLSCFTAIIKASYSFFTVLQQAEN